MVKTVPEVKEIDVDEPIVFLDRPEIDKDGTFTFASTVAFSRSIYLRPIPRRGFPLIEKDIIEVLNHESLHVAIYSLGLANASRRLDNILPFVGDWDKMLSNIKLRKEATEK